MKLKTSPDEQSRGSPARSLVVVGGAEKSEGFHLSHLPSPAPCMHIMGLPPEGSWVPGWAGLEMGLGRQEGRVWLGSQAPKQEAPSNYVGNEGQRSRVCASVSLTLLLRLAHPPSLGREGTRCPAGTKEVWRLGGLRHPLHPKCGFCPALLT